MPRSNVTRAARSARAEATITDAPVSTGERQVPTTWKLSGSTPVTVTKTIFSMRLAASTSTIVEN